MLQTIVKENGIYYMILAAALLGTILEFGRGAAVKKLLRAVENPDKTNHPFVKQLKLKYKSCCRLQRTIYNPDAFIENQLYHYRRQAGKFLGMQSAVNVCMYLCVLLGGLGMAAAYRYDMGIRIQAGCMLAGAMAAAVLGLAEQLAGCQRNFLSIYSVLEDYLENVLANQIENVPAGQQAAASIEQPEEPAEEEPAETPLSQEELKQRQAQEKIIADVIKEFFP